MYSGMRICVLGLLVRGPHLLVYSRKVSSSYSRARLGCFPYSGCSSRSAAQLIGSQEIHGGSCKRPWRLQLRARWPIVVTLGFSFHVLYFLAVCIPSELLVGCGFWFFSQVEQKTPLFVVLLYVPFLAHIFVYGSEHTLLDEYMTPPHTKQ